MLHQANKVLEYLEDVYTEIGHQEYESGVRSLPDGTGTLTHKRLAKQTAERVQRLETDGGLSWSDLLRLQVYNALSAENPADLIERLNSVAATSVTWIRAIHDR